MLRAVCLLVVVTRVVRVTASSPSAVAPVADGAGRQPPVLAGDQQVGISRSALVGVVVLAGRPVPGVHVSLFSASPTNGPGTVCPSCPPDCRKSATTDSEGRFRIEALDPTLRFDVLVHGPGCAPKLLYEVDPGRGPIQVKVEPPPQVAVPEQRVRGRVVDTAGGPSRAPSSVATASNSWMVVTSMEAIRSMGWRSRMPRENSHSMPQNRFARSMSRWFARPSQRGSSPNCGAAFRWPNW